jgi:hypothetical protein
VLHVRLTHTFSLVGGSVKTEDEAVLSPVPGSPGVFRVNARLTIIEGSGIYAGATGMLHTQGFDNFNTGSLNLEYHGHICR